MVLPVVLLTGTTAELREALGRALLLRDPGVVVVAYAVDPAPEGLVVRTVADGRRALDARRLGPDGCCLSCALRDDLPEVLDQLDDQDGGWERVLVVLPTPVSASALLPVVQDRVEGVVCAVDGLLLRSQLTGDALLADAGLAAAPTDRRSVAELVVTHLEDADVLAVGHLHRLATEPARTVEAVLSHLAPLAEQVPVGPGGSGCEDVLRSAGRGRVGEADREALAVLAADLCAPRCGVTTVLWRSDAPLHSGRLADALPALVEGLLRSRGTVWLADRAEQRLRWEQAGGSLSVGDVRSWDGTPRCELLLTGVGVDADDLRARLDACVATEAEQAALDWEDPFADVLGPAQRA
jgi:G3E family GTPase